MDILNEFTVGDMYIRHAIDETPDGRNYDLHIHDKCEIFYFMVIPLTHHYKMLYNNESSC
ncbi:hypothetical protein [Ruminococcus albus]|uniref:Uncharacterized protein n=1 Tax=Ruminococcus albus (strain ATCC 27210 / DSM 20455 / JCM 14654 / NCDO 2250 / 7) TaxID=697329 RepID=E6UDY6_RUMA7|nr:hypothetical protein [Ruminococcus albus]ADU21773.1 hypothetical protein Rumal_1257 [Ruminococcus albus 7 = DSM 20455]